MVHGHARPRGDALKPTELHLHLDGSLRPSTVAELARELALEVPEDLLFRPGMGLQDALSKFAFTLSLLQSPSSVRRVASEMCEDAAGALEIRFAPQLHGGVLEEVVDAALEGAAGRAGLILCALYGEPPSVAERLVDIAASRPGVVGVDLAGGPAPTHRFGMRDYGAAFARARDLGIGRTVHAAEGRSADEIRVAIEVLHAQRVGHGTTLLSKPDVVELVLQRGVTIEACPTSNVHTGVISEVAAHPLPKWLELGVRVAVCADNALLSAVSTAQEYERASKIPGMTGARMQQVAADALAARFTR